MKKTLSTIVFGLIITMGLQAQMVPAPREVNINIAPLRSIQTFGDGLLLDSLTNPMSLLTPNDTLLLSLSILLVDTANLSKIHVKLGTTLGGDDLFTNTYTYDSTPAGSLTYFRDRALMTLGMGTHLNSGIFYCEIKLEDSMGNFSALINSQTQQ